MEDIKKLLEQTSKEALIDFVCHQADMDEAMANRLRLHFKTTYEDRDLKEARKILQSAITRAKRDRYVDWRGVREVGSVAFEVIALGEGALQKGEKIFAAKVFLMVLRKMVTLLSYADDSNGDIGDPIREVVARLVVVVQDEAMSPKEKNDLFKLLVKEAVVDCYSNWADPKYDLLNMAASLVDDQKGREKLESILKTFLGALDNKPWNRYEKESIYHIQLQLIGKFEGPTVANGFIYDHIDLPSFRALAIDACMVEKDYSGALTLCFDGEKDDAIYAGLVSQWKKTRYDIYEVAGMMEEQRALAEALIYEGYFDYYVKLKETYEEEQWQTIYPGIHERLSKDNGHYRSIYHSVLIEEKAWFKLLNYVRERPSTIIYLHDYLIADYPLEVYKIYGQYIESMAEEENNRKGYRKVCREIKGLRKLGGSELAEGLIQQLKETYKRRPAFVEELGKLT